LLPFRELVGEKQELLADFKKNNSRMVLSITNIINFAPRKNAFKISNFPANLKNKQPFYGGLETTKKLWYCCAH
jgi:Txe/YoeB family toxin of Txe-Axe toxin-antitoxin module